MIKKDIPLWQLTTGEFTELLERCYRRMEISQYSEKTRQTTLDNEYVYGMAVLLSCLDVH